MDNKLGSMVLPGSIWTLRTDYYPSPPEALWRALGRIPYMLSAHEPYAAIEQFAAEYQGGWDALPGWALVDGHTLKYPGDPLMYPIAQCLFPIPGVDFACDTVLVFPYSWVCVKHPDMSFEVARLD